MEPFRKLVGLPTTGPWPEQFSATGHGTHREGFVVEFNVGTNSSWVGNFHPGLTDYAGRLDGTCWDAVNDIAVPFSVDIRTGDLVGGVSPEPPDVKP